MKKRVLGKSGLQVSEIGLGCNAFGGRIDDESTRKVINKAFDLGITMFDTSDLYGGTYGTPSSLSDLPDRNNLIEQNDTMLCGS